MTNDISTQSEQILNVFFCHCTHVIFEIGLEMQDDTCDGRSKLKYQLS